MQNYIKTTILLLTIALTSCEDVIDVTVQKAPTRLVIEASLDWEKGTTGNEQSIALRTSTAYFDASSSSAATGASVTVTNNASGAIVVFDDQNNGDYTTAEFVPVLGQSYTLEVIHDGQTYEAVETLTAVPDIIDMYQDREDGFSDEDLELHVVFNDPPEEGNSYLFVFQKEGELLPDLEVGFDEFVNGNEIDWWYELEDDEDTEKDESLQPGDVVDIEMYGISEAYKNYMEILLEQIDSDGPFQTTPVSVKGNCTNPSNPDNYAHGYFRVTEVNKTSYTIE